MRCSARRGRRDSERVPKHGADLDELDLSGVDLQGAHGLTQTQLARACGDAKTKLPRGLQLQSCSSVRAARLAPSAPSPPSAAPASPSVSEPALP